MKVFRIFKKRIKTFVRKRREQKALNFANQVSKRANRRRAENDFVQTRFENR